MELLPKILKQNVLSGQKIHAFLLKLLKTIGQVGNNDITHFMVATVRIGRVNGYTHIFILV